MEAMIKIMQLLPKLTQLVFVVPPTGGVYAGEQESLNTSHRARGMQMVDPSYDTAPGRAHAESLDVGDGWELWWSSVTTWRRADQPQRLDLGTTSVANHRHQDHWPSLHQSPIPETALNAGRVYHNQYPPKHNTLKLSLDSGLNWLGALMRLNKFQGVSHRVDTEELDWMKSACLSLAPDSEPNKTNPGNVSSDEQDGFEPIKPTS
ncbi:hypothetical protein K457DRAFT_124684 [Linnemannia elongata AG-77]|uniref:Uncharacterized protein n=1 Tax=Linnemannia elongata AG-77 TaxID=1314771 RepID=A0A197K059_9FUNG|nr:hypothetical protein K457DRAFT_124684 [Linnemannia elongata AG-77]